MPSIATTAAEDEFNQLLARNSAAESNSRVHPEDRDLDDSNSSLDLDEEDRHRAARIDAAMRMPTAFAGAADSTSGAMDTSGLRLPPTAFDNGHATGVKGVIADARSYEQARRSKWLDRARAVRRSVFGPDGLGALTLGANGSGSHRPRKSDSAASSGASTSNAEDNDPDEESFLSQWRESRRRELEAESARTEPVVRTRRTSPSARMFGRLDEVDALGYLDAIEKVGKEVVVVVFVYDHECEVSAIVESALRPLVSKFPAVHFVKVHYEEIEFENAGVPALLGYKQQGELFANLTGLVELLPDDEEVDPDSLERILSSRGIL